MQIKYTLDRESQEDLHGYLEDAIAQWCDQHQISGELAWLVTQCYSTARVEMFRGNLK